MHTHTHTHTHTHGTCTLMESPFCKCWPHFSNYRVEGVMEAEPLKQHTNADKHTHSNTYQHIELHISVFSTFPLLILTVTHTHSMNCSSSQSAYQKYTHTRTQTYVPSVKWPVVSVISMSWPVIPACRLQPVSQNADKISLCLCVRACACALASANISRIPHSTTFKSFPRSSGLILVPLGPTEMANLQRQHIFLTHVDIHTTLRTWTQQHAYEYKRKDTLYYVTL